MEFVDTNVLVYAHDRSAGTKQQAAKALLERLVIHRLGALSIQVFTEFYAVASSKQILPDDGIVAVMQDFSQWPVHQPTVSHLLQSAELRSRYRLSWFDALILNSALQLGCTTLWTEDFQDGQKFGDLTVRNPFAA